MTKKLDDIKKILNDMKPIGSDLLIFEGYIYSDASSFSCYWLINNQRNDFDFDSFPMKQSREIISHIKILKSNDDSWNNFRLCLDANGKFIFDMVNIDEENSWQGLYMKGISDLTEEEWKNTGIPKELWEERVRHKGTGTLGRPKSDFINLLGV